MKWLMPYFWKEKHFSSANIPGIPASVLRRDSFTADRAGQAVICLNVKYKATWVDHWAKPSAFHDTGFVSRLKESLVQKNKVFFFFSMPTFSACQLQI